jgi:prevent-host-death family protein
MSLGPKNPLNPPQELNRLSFYFYAHRYNNKGAHVRQNLTATDSKTTVLLRVASYLGRPQKVVAVADARAELRRTLELAAKGSVVLTNNGEPAAAVVPFSTLVDMRRALLHFLVEEMGASFALSRQCFRARRKDASLSSEEELEKLVGEALKAARRREKSIKKKPDSRTKR